MNLATSTPWLYGILLSRITSDTLSQKFQISSAKGDQGLCQFPAGTLPT